MNLTVAVSPCGGMTCCGLEVQLLSDSHRYLCHRAQTQILHWSCALFLAWLGLLQWMMLRLVHFHSLPTFCPNSNSAATIYCFCWRASMFYFPLLIASHWNFGAFLVTKLFALWWTSLRLLRWCVQSCLWWSFCSYFSWSKGCAPTLQGLYFPTFDLMLSRLVHWS